MPRRVGMNTRGCGVGPCLGCSAAAGELPALWSEGRGGALGGRQALLEQELHAVSGEVGGTAERAGSGGDLSV